MKVKSNLEFNTSLLSNHTNSAKEGKVVIGSSQPEAVLIPAGATLELDDASWKRISNTKSAQALLEKGHLVIVEAPKLSKKEQDAADKKALAKAKADAKELEDKLTKGA